MNVAAARDRIFARLNGRFFFGWAILAVAGLGLFASGPGQSHTFSVFVGPISRELGISSAAIATAYGVATLLAAFLLPQMGKLVDRYGARRMMLAVVLLLGASCFAFGAAINVFWLAIGFGLLRFFGQGSLMLNCANLVSQWFSRRRGFAMSLMALGFGVSMAVHPPLAEFLVSELGWRQAWMVLGILTWALMIPPVLLLVYDKPEALGLRPDGEPRPAAGDTGADPQITGLDLHQALRTPAFYIVAAAWFAIAMLVTTLHFYQVSILVDQGNSRAFAAWIFPISALTMVATMPLVGRAFDRFRTRHVVAFALAVTALSLTSITWAGSPAPAIFYAIVFGLNNALSMTLFGYIWPRYFGRRHLGSIQGTGQMIGVVGASLGPLPVGIAFDLTGSATTTLWLLALIPAAIAVAAMFLRTPEGVETYAHLE